MSTDVARSPYWDNLKGLLIFLVVLGHFSMYCPWLGFLTNSIYLFHMPAFLFISGYFSGTRSLDAHKFLRLIIIFLCFNTILMIGTGGKNPHNWDFFTIHLSSWYLAALILYRLSIPILNNSNIIKIFMITLSIGLLIGLIPEKDTFCLYKIIPLYPFFIAGFFWRKQTCFVPSGIAPKLAAAFIFVITVFSCIILTKYDILTLDHMLWFPYQSSKEGVFRLYLYLAGFACTMSLLALTPKRKIYCLTTWGKNSLIIFFIHRPVVIICNHFFAGQWTIPMMLLMICIILGICNHAITIKLFNSFFDKIVAHAKPTQKPSIQTFVIIGILLVSAFGCKRAFYLCRTLFAQPNHQTREITKELKPLGSGHRKELESCFRISYIGDLVFLSPQIHKAYDDKSGNYNFNECFQHTKHLFETDDYTIAVLEGPIAQNQQYSLTNCKDNKPIRLNYPASLIDAVKKSGVDFVTTATNHMLDQHLKGAKETANYLNSEKLPFVGFVPCEHSPRHKIVEMKNKNGEKARIAILAYTYGSNYVDESDFFQDPLKNHISCLVEPNSKHYEQSLSQVKEDIKRAKQDNPDCLVIMPHMGEQFKHYPDAFQKHWCNVFVEEGADIILADHPHATQPIEWINADENSKTSLIVYCPGNYANSYTDDDGDAVAIVEIYLNPSTKKPIACTAIPMWVSARGSRGQGQFIPIPIATIARKEIDTCLSNNDWERLQVVHPTITKSMLGIDIPLHAASLRYFSFAKDQGKHVFRDSKEVKLQLSDKIKQSAFYKMCIKHNHVCFIGDSITEGTMNMGYGWYEPLAATFPEHIKVSNFSKGSKTSTYFRDNSHAITDIQADLYVMAYGTNDIRYRNPNVCAMTPQQYIANISETVSNIRSINKSAKFAFIAPWCSYIYDKNCMVPDEKKEELLKLYTDALELWCRQEGHIFSNPNPIIKKEFNSYHSSAMPFWVDDIHPNGTNGTSLYASAVVESCKD